VRLNHVVRFHRKRQSRLFNVPNSGERPVQGWLGIASKPAQGIYILHQLNTHGSNDDGGSGGNSSDARCANRTMAHNRSHSTDTVGNNHRGNTHSNLDSRSLQTQFRSKPERQNAAPERKPIHLPPILLRELFSRSLFYLLIIRREVRQKASRSERGTGNVKQTRVAGLD